MNKETLQSYNTRLSTNNTSLNDILEVVNELPEYKEPSGTLEITENGTYDVKEYAEVTTNVSGNKFAPRTLKLNYYEGTELDYEVANIDASNLTSMSEMFNSCNKVTSLDLSHWDTSNVTLMTNVFNGCNSLTSLNLSGWNTSKTKNFASMFQQCYNLTSLDLSSFTTESIERAGYMFNGCNKLQYLDVRNFDFTKLKTAVTYNSIFASVPADCEIIVKDDKARNWVKNKRTDFTNIKTVAEL